MDKATLLRKKEVLAIVWTKHSLRDASFIKKANKYYKKGI